MSLEYPDTIIQFPGSRKNTTPLVDGDEFALHMSQLPSSDEAHAEIVSFEAFKVKKEIENMLTPPDDVEVVHIVGGQMGIMRKDKIAEQKAQIISINSGKRAA